MRDYIRDSHGRFADVPGAGDDAPSSRSATTPGGTRTSVPSKDTKTQPSEALKTSVTGSRSKKLNNYAETLDILAGIKRRQGNAAEARKISKVAANARKAAKDDAEGAEWERKRQEATRKQRADYEAGEKARRDSPAQRAHEAGMQQQKLRADMEAKRDAAIARRDAAKAKASGISGLTDKQIDTYLRNHQAAIDAGMNVGKLDRDKAQKMRAERAKRNSATQPGGTSTSLPRYSW